MPARLIAAMSALGLLATGGAVVGTASVITTTAQTQQLASQTEELDGLKATLQQLMEQTPKDGADGRDGQSGATGPEGDRGPAGIRGATGSDGAPGADGAPGTDGADGTDGINGTDGANGANGTNGTNGMNGVDGLNGANGRDASRQVQAFYWGGSTPTEGIAIGDFTPTLAVLHQSLAGSPAIVSNGDRLVWLSTAADRPLSFSMEQSGLYLVHYSIDSATLPPSVPLTIYGYASSSATMGLPVVVPGSRSLLTAGNASATFYVYLEQDATILFAGRSGAVNVTGFTYYPNVSFQLIEKGPCTRPICAA